MSKLFDHDALIAERERLLPEDRDFHYLMSEMVEPLFGGFVVGGFVHEEDDRKFPVLRVAVKGKVYQVIVSMDDEMNDGGRLIIQAE